MTWLWGWKHRERQALEGVLEAERQLAADQAQLEQVKAQRPAVEQLARIVTRETVEINGWTARAKRAFS